MVTREVIAGTTATFVAIPLALAIGTLAFAPLGPEYASDGARSGLIAAGVGGLAVALTQTRSFVISSASSATGLMVAAFVTTMLTTADTSAAMLVDVIPIVVLLAGIVTLLLGLLGLGRFVAFTPQPIFAGFVSGVGLLILTSQIPKLLGMGSWTRVGSWIGEFGVQNLVRCGFGVALVALMIVLARRRPQLPSIAVGFLVGVVLYHGLGAIFPVIDLGTTIGAMPATTVHTLRDVFAAFDEDAWSVVAQRWRLVLTAVIPLALVIALESMIARRLAESLVDLPRASRRNLAATGLGSIAAGLVGGIPASGSPAQVTANFRAGGRDRLSVLSVCACMLLLLLFAPGFTAFVPAIVPSAVLVVVGFRLIDSGFVARIRTDIAASDPEGRKRAAFDLVTFLAVMIPTAIGELILGVGLGIAISVAIFLMRMGRPVVRRRSFGDLRRSKRIRPTSEALQLERYGHETLVLELEGVLFFGNADDLSLVIRRHATHCRQIILQMRRVNDVDSTGVDILRQAVDRARAKSCEIVLCHVGAALGPLHGAGPGSWQIFRDLDAALEWAENAVLARHRSPSQSVDSLPIGALDICAGLPAEDVERLATRITRARYEAGEVLCRAGEPADRMWLLAKGSVSIRTDEASSRRINAIARGTTVGEMALIEGGVRSATVIADEEVEAYLLTKESFDHLLSAHPQLANRLMHNLARELVRRLRQATTDVARAE